MWRWLALALLIGIGSDPGFARGLRYDLTPDQVADGVYVFWGLQEAWNFDNGGNIVNTGFIVGEESVLAIDAGTTRFYGDEMVAVIRSVTDKPIRTAIITHHHPDHAFGMAQLKRANAVVMMHPAAKAWLLGEGPAVLGFMEVPMGPGWLAGTEITKPNRLIRKATTFDLGGRTVQAIPLVGGHTSGDIIVLDDKTGTLFAGDLVFNERAPTVPHADVPVWLDHLRTLRGMDWQRLVPGHGPLITDPAAFGPMEDYLRFLDAHAREAVQSGEMLAETLAEPLPEEFQQLHSVDDEYGRSMRDLFRKYETSVLDAAVTVN